MSGTPTEPASRPVLRVLSGSPTAEELAVLAALVTTTSSTPDEDSGTDRGRRGGWNDPAGMHRRAHRPGPNGWRAAAW